LIEIGADMLAQPRNGLAAGFQRPGRGGCTDFL